MPARSGHFAALDSTDKKVYRLCSGLSSEAYNPAIITADTMNTHAPMPSRTFLRITFYDPASPQRR